MPPDFERDVGKHDGQPQEEEPRVRSTPLPGVEPALSSPSVGTPIFGRPPPVMRLGRNVARAKRAARRRIVYSSEDEEPVPEETSRRNLKWRDRRPLVLKYVDDNLQIDRVNMETASRGEEAGTKFRDKHSVQCQNTFRAVIRKAEERGMKVNSKKTAMTCISGAQSYEARAHIFDGGGERVKSGPTMKLLGFHMSSSPTVHAHVDALCKRMRQKYWVLYHLKKTGFTEEELAKVYRTCLLPFLDYCSVVYHAMLTDDQDQKVERLQAAALRCIYGYDTSYARMRELASVTTLRQRRIDACDKFANKCLGIPRFASKWFPLKTSGRSGIRGNDLYKEEYARCNRLLNSPVFYMRRRLNGKEGRIYGERNKKYRDTNTDEVRSAGVRGRKNPRLPK